VNFCRLNSYGLNWFLGGVLLVFFSAREVAGMSFGDDVSFLKEHVDVLVLMDGSGKAQVAVVPAYQARVMTSSAAGNEGISFGWINRKLIASGKIQPHINVYGGEERFWLGPEGGQFALFFEKNTPYDLEHWQTPPLIDTEPFQTVKSSRSKGHFRRNASLTNRAGFTFQLRIDRKIQILGEELLQRTLGKPLPPQVNAVGYETRNTITNVGGEPWKKETGLLSIWLLGMFNPSDGTTVVIPFRTGSDEALGAPVNDAYFGKVPEDRLVVRGDVLFFSGDGKYRSKIGIGPQRAKPSLGSYDAESGTLTLVRYTKPEGATDYVNSMWEDQKEPYKGDVVNSYNDGPPEPDAEPLGPFYELETSSQAAALQPGESLTHVQQTLHLQGDREALSQIAQDQLGVTLEEIQKALPR